MSDFYVIGIDQSTQGTKAVLFDEKGALLGRADVKHSQHISEEGWVSHDMEEIYRNVLKACDSLLNRTSVPRERIRCIGISNQRETTAAWNRKTGEPYSKAIVWQCSRAEGICREIESRCDADRDIYRITGIRLTPYYPASKMAWLLKNIPGLAEDARTGKAALGTMDSWLVYRLTGGFYTDCSNASRTQLMNLASVSWDENICGIFGIPIQALPDIRSSDSVFGETDLEGILPDRVPVAAVMGDSHAALFGHNCRRPGTMKVTYGTGSSVALNTGSQMILSRNGLTTSIAWKAGGRVAYILEGNINYTGAVFSWMKDDLKLIQSTDELEEAVKNANPNDSTYIVPAFSGLGAPWWADHARAAFLGMSRSTGKNEMIKAACESIAYQVNDVIEAMRQDTELNAADLCVDGGPTRNRYLMQYQSDISCADVQVPDAEELSAAGAAYLAGMSSGNYGEEIFEAIHYERYTASMEEQYRKRRLEGWREAVKAVTGYHQRRD